VAGTARTSPPGDTTDEATDTDEPTDDDAARPPRTPTGR
jgi:hypothetical protein